MTHQLLVIANIDGENPTLSAEIAFSTKTSPLEKTHQLLVIANIDGENLALKAEIAFLTKTLPLLKKRPCLLFTFFFCQEFMTKKKPSEIYGKFMK